MVFPNMKSNQKLPGIFKTKLTSSDKFAWTNKYIHPHTSLNSLALNITGDNLSRPFHSTGHALDLWCFKKNKTYEIQQLVSPMHPSYPSYGWVHHKLWVVLLFGENALWMSVSVAQNETWISTPSGTNSVLIVSLANI